MTHVPLRLKQQRYFRATRIWILKFKISKRAKPSARTQGGGDRERQSLQRVSDGGRESARVERILQIALNVTLTAGEYVQFILMETYRNITSALPTTNWFFKPIPPCYRLSNGARDYSPTIRNS